MSEQNPQPTPETPPAALPKKGRLVVPIRKKGSTRGDSVAFKGAASTFTWGIESGIVTMSGRIVSIRVRRSIDKEELQDEEGEVDGLVYLDSKTAGTIECILPVAGASIALASALEVDGYGCFVESVEKNWERRGFAKYTVEVSGYDLIATS